MQLCLCSQGGVGAGWTEYNVAAARTSNGGSILKFSGQLTPRAVTQPLSAAVRLPVHRSPEENLCPGAVQPERIDLGPLGSARI
ncbi:hypothetical protein CHU98_g8385 [Xylaria longipes]|nr:hypothetical protein CHU98_g8385 [Xylaria longipes]